MFAKLVAPDEGKVSMHILSSNREAVWQQKMGEGEKTGLRGVCM